MSLDSCTKLRKVTYYNTMFNARVLEGTFWAWSGTNDLIAKSCWEGLGYITFRQQARKGL